MQRKATDAAVRSADTNNAAAEAALRQQEADFHTQQRVAEVRIRESQLSEAAGAAAHARQVLAAAKYGTGDAHAVAAKAAARLAEMRAVLDKADRARYDAAAEHERAEDAARAALAAARESAAKLLAAERDADELRGVVATAEAEHGEAEDQESAAAAAMEGAGRDAELREQSHRAAAQQVEDAKQALAEATGTLVELAKGTAHLQEAAAKERDEL